MPFLIVRKPQKTDAIIRLQNEDDLPDSAEHVISASVPFYDSGSPQESECRLESAYLETLEQAEESQCRRIAIPMSSALRCGYPAEVSFEAAESAARRFLEDHDLMIYLVRERPAAEKRDAQLDAFLSLNLEPEMMSACALPEGRILLEEDDVDDAVRHLGESFQSALFRIIDAKGLTDAEVYRKANLDRRLFSKIRSQKDYRPGKRTILALCIALKLSREETEDLLEKGGYSLSMSQVSDVIIAYFITHGNYDIYEINEVLFRYDQQLLGS